MKRYKDKYKFQALVTMEPPGEHGPPGEQTPPGGHGPALMPPPGGMQRIVLRGEHHHKHCSQVFSALITNTGEDSAWLAQDHLIVTIQLVGDELREYFDVGDPFSLWLGGDIGRGIVTRRLFV